MFLHIHIHRERKTEEKMLHYKELSHPNMEAEKSLGL